MLENKRVKIVLALIIAVGLWAYVIGDTNPEDTKTFRNIPIELLNEETLTEQDLAVLETSAEQMSVTLKGKRADINRITDKDVRAVVNLADAGKGENQLSVSLRTPDSVEITDQSISRVTVMVEDRVSKEVEVVPHYEGTFASDQEPITVEMSNDSVIVTGAKSLVERVASVTAKIPEGKVSDELRTISAEVFPINDEGQKIGNLKLSVNKVEITTELAKTKTVDLEVPIIDDSNQADSKRVDAPKTITIKGRGGDLAKVESITAEEIDLTNVTEDKEIEIIPHLPDGVQLSAKSEGKLRLKVTVTKTEDIAFTFREKDIELEGLQEGLRAVLADTSVEITVNGSKSQIGELTKENFRLSADISDLKEGEHRVAIQVVCDKDNVRVEVNPEEIGITIAKEER